MHCIFGIFRPLQTNHVCDNFRPHGTAWKHPEVHDFQHFFPLPCAGMPFAPFQVLAIYRVSLLSVSCSLSPLWVSPLHPSKLEIKTPRGRQIVEGDARDQTPAGENYFDHPHPPILARDMSPKCAINRGVVWRKNPWNKGTCKETMVNKPTFMAYELRLLWHTNPDFYAIWAGFIGGGDSLQFVERAESSCYSLCLCPCPGSHCATRSFNLGFLELVAMGPVSFNSPVRDNPPMVSRNALSRCHWRQKHYLITICKKKERLGLRSFC